MRTLKRKNPIGSSPPANFIKTEIALRRDRWNTAVLIATTSLPAIFGIEDSFIKFERISTWVIKETYLDYLGNEIFSYNQDMYRAAYDISCYLDAEYWNW